MSGRTYTSRVSGADPDTATRKVWRYEPVGFDLWEPNVAAPAPGTRVIKTQPHGCPKNGTFGHCYIKDAETGEFYGLVLENSLQTASANAEPNDQRE